MSSMYYQNRSQAARQLLPPLLKYRYENTIIVALSDSSVEIAETLAASLHCNMTLFLALDIDVPGESVTFGSITEGGVFSMNRDLSQSEVTEYYSEFRGYIEEQKRTQTSNVHRLMGAGGLLDPVLLRDHIVILVSDGLKSGGILDAAYTYLKMIRLERLVIATPIASVTAVDRMHIIGDELHVLNVAGNFMDTNHYYVENNCPSHDEILEKINRVVLSWQ